jgi:hypothetical protein
MTTKTPAQGPRFLLNVSGDRLQRGMLAVQSKKETTLEVFGSPDRDNVRPDNQQGRRPKSTARFTTAVTPRRRAEGARHNGGKKSS